MPEPSRLQKLEAMLELDPQDQTLRYMLALELDKAAQNERSLELLFALSRDESPYVPAYLMAGQQLARLGRTSEAASMYRDGIAEAQRQKNDHAAGEMQGFLAELGCE